MYADFYCRYKRESRPRKKCIAGTLNQIMRGEKEREMTIEDQEAKMYHHDWGIKAEAQHLGRDLG